MRETILSVGIDIGTSTTSVVFSEMEIANLASEFHVPDIQVINKKIVYRSPIYFTPLRSNSELNIDIQLKDYAIEVYKYKEMKTMEILSEAR